MIFVNKRENQMSEVNFYFGTNNRRKVKCATCGKIFYTSHPSKKTCSIECSMDRKKVASKELNENNKRYYSKVKNKK